MWGRTWGSTLVTFIKYLSYCPLEHSYTTTKHLYTHPKGELTTQRGSEATKSSINYLYTHTLIHYITLNLRSKSVASNLYAV